MTKILVIDDDEGVRLTLRHVLASKGYDVSIAADGVEGLQLALASCPEIVLTDLLMPKQEGIETIGLLKQECPQIKVIAMSGGRRTGYGDILESAMRAGADHVIAKPFDLGNLLGLLPSPA